jgi:hypothetical protein
MSTVARFTKERVDAIQVAGVTPQCRCYPILRYGSSHIQPQIYQCTRTSVADPDPGSGDFLPPGSGIRDGAMVGSGSGIRDKLTKFVNSLCKKEVGSGIRDPVLFYPPDPGSGSGMEQWSDPDPGSGIKHPGFATLTRTNTGTSILLFVNDNKKIQLF